MAPLTRMKAVPVCRRRDGELRGPKGKLTRVRVLLAAQRHPVEISVSDSFVLGVKAPLRMSGNSVTRRGIEIIGPAGESAKRMARIVAWRHILFLPPTSAAPRATDGD